MSFTTRKSLIARISSGEEVAWENFYKMYAPLIRKIATDKWGFDKPQADQLISDVICSVYNNGVFRYDASKGKFRAWLRSIIKNKAIDLKADINEGSALTMDAQTDEIDKASNPADLSREFERTWDEAWRMQILKEAMDIVRASLAPKTWQAFELMTIKELSAKEVADALGLSETNAYVSKHRVIKELRRQVGLILEQERQEAEI